MRFLQIHNFYDQYLQDWYNNNPALIEKSVSEQTEALLADGFSATHLFAQSLPALGYETKMIIANCAPIQVRWAMDHGLKEIRQDRWMYEIVAHQIADFRPDILYITSPIEFDSRFVRALGFRPRLVAGWRSAAIPPQTDFSEFGIILSSDPVSREKALAQGAKAVKHFVPGFPEFLATRVQDEPKLYDVTFSGQVTREHTRRFNYLSALCGAAKSTRGFTPALFVPRTQPPSISDEMNLFNHGSVWGLEMHRALKRGRICLNASIDFAQGEAGNMRQFEVTGTGSFLLTDFHPSVHQYFTPGTDIETYSNENELLEKVRYYLEHEKERELIAQQGQARCLRDHSMSKRTQEFHEIISKLV